MMIDRRSYEDGGTGSKVKVKAKIRNFTKKIMILIINLAVSVEVMGINKYIVMVETEDKNSTLNVESRGGDRHNR